MLEAQENIRWISLAKSIICHSIQRITCIHTSHIFQKILKLPHFSLSVTSPFTSVKCPRTNEVCSLCSLSLSLPPSSQSKAPSFHFLWISSSSQNHNRFTSSSHFLWNFKESRRLSSRPKKQRLRCHLQKPHWQLQFVVAVRPAKIY